MIGHRNEESSSVDSGAHSAPRCILNLALYYTTIRNYNSNDFKQIDVSQNLDAMFLECNVFLMTAKN